MPYNPQPRSRQVPAAPPDQGRTPSNDLRRRAARAPSPAPAVRALLGARVSSTVALQMQAVAVSWQMYDLTRNPLDLGLVGLTQFIPAALFVLVAGHVADRYDRRMIVRICQLICGLATATLAIGTAGGWMTREALLAIVFVIGVVPRLRADHADHAAAGHRAAGAAAARHRGGRIGDAARGDRRAGDRRAALCGEPDPGLCAVLRALHHRRPADRHGRRPSAPRPRASRSASRCCSPASPISGAIRSSSARSRSTCSRSSWAACSRCCRCSRATCSTPDRGGSACCAPSPGVGALIAAIVLTHWQPRQHVGRIMFGAVAIYGIAIIVFALSQSFVLSMVALAALGAADMVSVVIRMTLIQLADAGRHARPGQRGELAVRDRVEPARRIPRRPDGGLARRHPGGADRRDRRAAGGADRTKGVLPSSTGSRPSSRRGAERRRAWRPPAGFGLSQ